MRHGAEILPQKQNSEIRDQEAGRLEQLGQGNLQCGGSFGKLVLKRFSRLWGRRGRGSHWELRNYLGTSDRVIH